MRGHAYRRVRAGAWCACGHYCGGLGSRDGAHGARAVYRYAKIRHELHLVQVRNEQGRVP